MDRAPSELLRRHLEENFGKIFPDLQDACLTLEASHYQGYLNKVFVAKTSSRKYIVRVKQATENTSLQRAIDIYSKERWCMSAARQAGVKSSMVLAPIAELGELTGYGNAAVMLQEFLFGETASEKFERFDWSFEPKKRLDVLVALGAEAKKINSIMCQGYGSEFLVEKESFAHQWVESLLFEYERFGGFKRLPEVCSRLQENKVNAALESLQSISRQPCLMHADLNLTNVLIDPGTLEFRAILDWERAAACIQPEGELMQVLYQYLWLERAYTPKELRQCFQSDGIPKEFEAFLEGYQISTADYQRQYRTTVEALLCLRMGAYQLWWEHYGASAPQEWAYRKSLADAILSHAKLDE